MHMELISIKADNQQSLLSKRLSCSTLVKLEDETDLYSLCLCPLVCVYLNKYGKVGPHLDQQRLQLLPDHFGPGRASSVLQQCVQACVDSAPNQASVFSCLKSGQGGEVISGESLSLRPTQSVHATSVSLCYNLKSGT